MLRRFAFILICFSGILVISCHSNRDSKTSGPFNQKQLTEKLIDANKAAIETENNQIEKRISESGWKMIETGTGLRYQIIENGNGAKASPGRIVKCGYEVSLITGELIYSSVQKGPMEFKIGSGGVESGLEEGMLLLKVGDKARFIIPSYLGHGLSGDQDKIPPKATLIYTVKLIDLK